VALGEPEVVGELAELAERRGRLASAEDELGQPLAVETGRLQRRLGPGLEVDIRVEQIARDLQLLVDRLAAISRCMISLEPSKMRLMRMSRSVCSAGTGFSPRARNDSAVS
jgi:hypothetical protein